MDKFNIDGHKLMYHTTRVNDWLHGKNIPPIYMEVSLSGCCNHRCTFCALDFMGYQKRFLDAPVLMRRLTELGNLGIKSIMYGGEGEPLLHEQAAEIINHTRMSGIDAALTTNAALLDRPLADSILGALEWMKVSIGAATPETYRKIHRTKKSDFQRVIDNLSYAAEVKAKNGYNCALGMQMLLLPENRGEAVLLAKTARDIGMDYLVIKPYSQHPLSNTDRYSGIRYDDYMDLADELAGINTDEFCVIFRTRTMKKWDGSEREYARCLALPFWSYIDAGGNVWGCSVYLGDKRFIYGNIYEKAFQEIWESAVRMKSLHWVENGLDADTCRVNCRMDEINRYLWKLRNPVDHVNFI